MNKKKIISVLLISLLLINSNSALALAEDASEKEEIVYVNLNDDGTVKDITVVNSFETGSNQTIVDYGDYSSVRNMTSEDLITYESDKISINTTSDKTYYEGMLNSTSIPWKIDIKYVLDGRSVTSGELAGSSGHLKIKLDISKNDAFEGNFYEGYALQVSLSLDSYKCFNITSDGATIANVGSDKQLSYIILPNKGKDITIETDVVDFEYDGISINGVKLNLNIEVDSSELDDKVNEITDAVSKLDDGASDLKDGTKKLYDGALYLYDGANQVSSGANTLYAGFNELSNSSSSINSGVQQVADAILKTVNTSLKAEGFEEITWDNFDSKLKDYMNVTDAEIANAKAQIKEKAGDVDDATVDALIYMAATNTDSSKTFEEKVVLAGTELKQAQTIQNSDEFKLAYQIKTSIEQNQFDFDSTNQKVTQVLTAIRTQIAASPSREQLDTTYATVVGKVQDALKGTGQEVDTETAGTILAYACENPVSGNDILDAQNIENAAKKVNAVESPEGASDPRNDEAVVTVLKSAYASTVNQMSLKDVYKTLIDSLKESAADNASLVFAYGVTKHESYDVQKDIPRNFFTEYSGDLTKLANASANLENSKSETGQQVVKATLTQIVAQTLDKSLSPVLEQLNGVNNLVQGVKKYTAGVDSAFAGSKTLANGASQVANGSKQIKDGASSLLSGVNDLKDGTSEFSSKTNKLSNEVNDKIDEMIDEITAGDIETTSFVSGKNSNVDAVQFVIKTGCIKKVEETNDTVETNESSSFIDKLLNLFGIK